MTAAARVLGIMTFLAFTLCLAALAAPFLKMKDAVAGVGEIVSVTIHYEDGGDDVAALQFDMTSSSGIAPIAAMEGPAAVAAQKQVASNLSIPRILVYGLNAIPIRTGDLVITQFQLKPWVAPGRYPIRIKDPFYAAPDGTNVAGAPSMDGTLTVEDRQAPEAPENLHVRS